MANLDFVALSYHIICLGSFKKISHPLCWASGHDCFIRTGENNIDFYVVNLHFTFISAVHCFESGIRNAKKEESWQVLSIRGWSSVCFLGVMVVSSWDRCFLWWDVTVFLAPARPLWCLPIFWDWSPLPCCTSPISFLQFTSCLFQLIFVAFC